MQFPELLKHCTDPKSPQRENAWLEFLKRYKIPIYNFIKRRCYSWNVSRLDRQFSDVVDDIVSEVFLILYNSLGTYREVDNEKKFVIWLSTICNRASSHHLQKNFIQVMTDFNIDEFTELVGGLSFDNRWELYESTISRMRRLHGSKKQNLERDMNIFLMYIWSDFSDKMVLAHPCYNQIGGRVIDNVINRMRKLLREDKIL